MCNEFQRSYWLLSFTWQNRIGCKRKFAFQKAETVSFQTAHKSQTNDTIWYHIWPTESRLIFTLLNFGTKRRFFYTIKFSLRPNAEKSYYQTFVQTRTKKVILSNFTAEAVNFFIFFGRFFSESEICAYIYSQNLLIYIYAHSKSQPRACGAGR